MSASANSSKPLCTKCPKGYGQAICGGCQQWFCYKHLHEHRQELALEMDYLGQEHDDLQCEIISNENYDQHPLFVQIDQWEQKAIHQIRHVAEETRLKLKEYHQQRQNVLKESLESITRELQTSRINEDYNEIELKIWTEKFKELRQQFKESFTRCQLMYADETSPSNMIRLIEFRTAAIESKSSQLSSVTNDRMATWTETGTTVIGANIPGRALNQLSYPYGIYIDRDDDETIYIADCGNHRILAWKPGTIEGTIVAGGNGNGNANNQLHEPAAILLDHRDNSFIISDCGNQRIVRWSRENERIVEILLSDIVCYGLTLDRNGNLYICDHKRNEVRRYSNTNDTIEATIVAGGQGVGDHLNQLNGPWDVVVDDESTVYVSDHNNHRVMKWLKDATEGTIVVGGNSAENNERRLSGPTGLFLDGSNCLFIVDRRNHRIIRYSMSNNETDIIFGRSGSGTESNQFYAPTSLSFDRQGNLYVSDYRNHRIQRFSRL